MPMLLEDLAIETSASNRRTAERLDAEARYLDRLGHAHDALEGLRQRAVESARQATDYAVSQVSQAEGFWRWARVHLCKNPTGDEAQGLLHALLEVFESGLQLVRASRALWAIPEQLNAAPERLNELDQAQERFGQLAAEARLGLEHRARPWQPADPDRLAQGLQLAREGKTLKADEVRGRFRRTPS